jgi:hypothetical protein
MQQVVHYFFHLLFPIAVAYFFYKPDWRKVYTIFLLTMLVDADHLLANPIFDPCRCSIGFHPFHSFIACLAYTFLLVPKKTRVIAIGLLMHMATDGIDCTWSRLNGC